MVAIAQGLAHLSYAHQEIVSRLPGTAGVHARPPRESLHAQIANEPRAMVINPNAKVFDAGGDLLQIGDDHILHVDGGKEAAEEKHKTSFKDIARITVVRSKTTGRVAAIEYKTKGQLSAFRIDGCKRAEMEEIASLLESRTKDFSIQWVEKRGDTSLIPLYIIAVFAVLLGYLVYLVWRYPLPWLGQSGNEILLALTLLGVIAICIAVYGALFWRKQG
jgi:hypothetical protein